MNKIQRLSRYFCIVAMIAIVVLPLLLVLFWVDAPHSFLWGRQFGFSFSFLPQGLKLMHTLTPMDRILGFLISLIPTGVIMLVLYFLIRLFRLYGKAQIFTSANIRCLKEISYVLLIGQVLNLIYQALITMTMTWHNPQGYRYIGVSIGGHNVGIVLIALVTLMIAWIMDEGRRLKQDNSRIV